jgi:colanic acid/amylovoran biosynthesis glycosyltransferase
MRVQPSPVCRLGWKPRERSERTAMKRTLAMVHNNPVRMDGGRVFVDRKFLVGMQHFAAEVDAQILTIHPEAAPDDLVMDEVAVDEVDLGYEVMTVKLTRAGQPVPEDMPRLKDCLGRADLVYGYGLGSIALARELGVPYAMALEYDLRTRLVVTTSEVPNPLRKVSRAIKCLASYARDALDMRGARGLHCNGYPIYDETAPFNRERLLYLDSRMPRDMVIPQQLLHKRIEGLQGRRLRMLYSGRYEHMKGATDAVEVAIECLRSGLDVEMHCYGQGGLRETMVQMAEQAPVAGRIFIHDAIPFPELAARSREFDLFVCCHIQSDPSCTYLESLGAGLPIVGYANRMWKRMNSASGAGVAASMHKPQNVARSVHQLAASLPLIRDMSKRAREFALAHTSEQEFSKRVRGINAMLAGNG